MEDKNSLVLYFSGRNKTVRFVFYVHKIFLMTHPSNQFTLQHYTHLQTKIIFKKKLSRTNAPFDPSEKTFLARQFLGRVAAFFAPNSYYNEVRTLLRIPSLSLATARLQQSGMVTSRYGAVEPIERHGTFK